MSELLMRLVVFFCLAAVSCASPDVPRVDGVPEDPGGHLPTLPINPMPEAPAPPNGGRPPADATEDGRAQQDAGSPAGVTPAPTDTTASPATSGAPLEPGRTIAGEDAGALSPCLQDGGASSGDPDAAFARDGGSTADGGCHGQ